MFPIESWWRWTCGPMERMDESPSGRRQRKTETARGEKTCALCFRVSFDCPWRRPRNHFVFLQKAGTTHFQPIGHSASGSRGACWEEGGSASVRSCRPSREFCFLSLLVFSDSFIISSPSTQFLSIQDVEVSDEILSN